MRLPTRLPKNALIEIEYGCIEKKEKIMEKMSYEYPAGAPARARVLAGVVGAVDLEVLLEPGVDGVTTVSICTSVDGMAPVWQALLDRILNAKVADAGNSGNVDSDVALPAVRLEINDFGATPGVVRLRIAQAFDELKQGAQP